MKMMCMLLAHEIIKAGSEFFHNTIKSKSSRTINVLQFNYVCNKLICETLLNNQTIWTR